MCKQAELRHSNVMLPFLEGVQVGIDCVVAVIDRAVTWPSVESKAVLLINMSVKAATLTSSIIISPPHRQYTA